MSMPALRPPKETKQQVSAKPNATQIMVPDVKDFLIVTLKDGKKLVVTSDAYHGIFTAGKIYKCVFCEKELPINMWCKENHKNSVTHRQNIENYPHAEDFKENLIRKISVSTYYCTICNVIVLSHFLHKHISAEIHSNELEKALIRAESYKPVLQLQPEQEFPPLKKKSRRRSKKHYPQK